MSIGYYLKYGEKPDFPLGCASSLGRGKEHKHDIHFLNLSRNYDARNAATITLVENFAENIFLVTLLHFEINAKN